MNGNNLHNSKKDFFVQLHDFDEVKVEDIAEEDLPPPMFTEEEIAEARKKAFEEGKSAGLKEALGSIEQRTSNLLDVINSKISSLLIEEESRKRIFEREALVLAAGIFKKIFPFYYKEQGFKELIQAIQGVLVKQNPGAHIQIFVPPALLEAVKTRFAAVHDYKLEISAQDDLTEGSCVLQWQQGGAFKSCEVLCEEIRITLEQLLEDKAAKGHDNEIEPVQETVQETPNE